MTEKDQKFPRSDKAPQRDQDRILQGQGDQTHNDAAQVYDDEVMGKDHEGNRLSQRMGRYARVSGNLGGAFAKILSERLLGKHKDESLQAKALTLALGNLKGPVMKVAQILATIPDAVPEEYQLEFLSLQADAPSMGWPFVRRRMAAELGANWQEKFSNFERHAAAAASLGQVHKAWGLDGEAYACKLQYPEMSSTVEADLKQLKLILKLYESSLGGLKTNGIFAEISERLREELDYKREALQMQLYGEILKAFPQVHIPKVIESLSTKRLLTMQWLEGVRFYDVLDASQDVRNRLATSMFLTWYYPLYNWGVIHGDPHLGNYSFKRQDTASQNAPYEINLLDFGCIRRFRPEFIEGVINLYKAMQKGDEARAVHAYEQWGFKNLTKEMLDVLNMWAHLLYEPILDDRIRPLQADNSGQYGREIADKVHQELRRLGGIEPPREFVFMDRAAVGVGSVCLRLRAEANWCTLFNELIQDFSIEKIYKNQEHPLFQELGLVQN